MSSFHISDTGRRKTGAFFGFLRESSGRRTMSIEAMSIRSYLCSEARLAPQEWFPPLKSTPQFARPPASCSWSLLHDGDLPRVASKCPTRWPRCVRHPVVGSRARPGSTQGYLIDSLLLVLLTRSPAPNLVLASFRDHCKYVHCNVLTSYAVVNARTSPS